MVEQHIAVYTRTSDDDYNYWRSKIIVKRHDTITGIYERDTRKDIMGKDMAGCAFLRDFIDEVIYRLEDI